MLCTAVKGRDRASFENLLATSSWLSFALVLKDDASGQQFIYVDDETPFSSQLQSAGTSGNGWVCSHCTFFNPSNSNECDMCALPR